MKHQDWILNSAIYIEEHLKDELTIEAVSSWSGYSPYYFSRCFKEKFGIPPMEYVKQRRLIEAAKEIRKGRRIVDAALDYGWQTHSGFTKSFISQFGYSPVVLRACFIRDAEWKGDHENMDLYLKRMELYKKPEELWEELCLTLEENCVEYDWNEVRKAYEIAVRCHEGQKRKSGEEYITHPLNTAIILADMGAGEDLVCAGLLHDTDGMENEETLTEDTRQVLKEYLDFKRNQKCTGQRGILVALADRLHNLRTIEFVDSSTWKQRAEETLRLFSPLAAECGDIRLVSELQELSLKRF